MRWRTRAWAVLAVLVVLLGALPSAAQPDLRAQARRHFAQAVALFESGDHQAALAEFEAAQALQGHPRILGNIAATQEALRRYVDAVATLERLIADPQATPPARRDAARHLRGLRALLASLEITAEPAGAEVLVDGRLVGVAPLAAPVVVSSGQVHVVVRSAGHRPEERAVSVAAGGVLRETFSLVPLRTRLHLDANAAGARARIGDRAPRALPADLTLAPGTHRVRTEAPGYLPDAIDLVLQPGDDRTLTVVLERLPATLRLRIAPAAARVFIDGEARAAAGRSAVTIAGGTHRIRVDGPGLVPWDQEVRAEAGGSHVLHARLGRDRLWVRPAWFWGGLIGTTALTAAASVTGVRALILDRELHRPQDIDDPADLARVHRDRDRMVSATDILLVGALTAAAGTVVLYLLSRGEPPDPVVSFH